VTAAAPAFDADAMLADLGRLVACESPSDDLAALERSADEIAALGRRLFGRDPERHGVHLRWTFGTPRFLVLGHHDTVWPRGTIDRWPMVVDGDRVSGPGCFDMKGGLVLAMHAVAALPSPEGVVLLWTGDEEIGAPTSQDLIVDTARGLEATLVTEPCAGGAVKVARKGIRVLRLTVTGRASHAGLEPEKGVNAGVELAHHLVAVSGWTRPDGLTLVPTLVEGGTTMNTVPATASAVFDMRGPSAADMDRMEQRLRDLVPVLDGAALEVTRHHGRGPLEASASASLFRLARDVAMDLGQGDLGGVEVGGVSDGNFTAAAGVPTLDGLGVIGDGAHAEGEWCSLASMVDRAQLVHGMLARLQREGLAP
jgi:glutamate carboxypeptidase